MSYPTCNTTDHSNFIYNRFREETTVMFLPNAGFSSDGPSEIVGAMIEGMTKLSGQGRSSIIGIVTAIIGNILISFALNTQRYAHIRLRQERDEQQEKNSRNKQGYKGAGGYGTQQEEIAEDRAKKNLSWEQTGKQHDSHGQGGATESETAPLLRSSGARKASHSSDSTEDSDQGQKGPKSYLSSPWWWLGIALMVIGECGNFLAYGFAPASVVSPLGVVALVSNCLIAPLMLHERFRKRDGLGVLIAVGGCVTVVLSASGSDPKLDQDEIWYLVTRWEFELYLGITVALIIALMFMSNKYGDRTVLIDLGLVGLFGRSIMFRITTLLTFDTGGYTALSTKGVASLLSNTIWRTLTFPISYLLVAVLVSTAVMQVRYVNKALQRFDSTQVIPVQFVLFTLSVIIGSAVLYRDFERRTAEDAGKFVAGCALTFLGVWCITSGRAEQEDDESERAPEDEDAIDLVDEEAVENEDQFDQDQDVRRSSLRPPTPQRMRSSQSDAPIFQFTQYDDDRRNSNAEPSPFTGSGWKTGTTPAVASAIHDDGSPIPSQSPQNKKPPPIHATTSAPLLPTIHMRPERPVTPSRYTTGPSSTDASRDYRPRTPDGSANPPEPASPNPRFGSMGRHSMAGLVPGPLMNPLSHSLSAIVADSLRRGVDTAPGSSMKRRALRSSKSARRLPRDSTGEGADLRVTPRRGVSEQVLGANTPLSPEPPQLRRNSSVKGRGRSVSATLGDLLMPKRQRRGTLEDGDGQER